MNVGKNTPATLVLPDNWTGSVPVDNKTAWYGGYFNYTAPVGLFEVVQDAKIIKFFLNGQIFISFKEKIYNMMGVEQK
ncbi:MAG: hypothetical protein MJ003_07585 [Paludibacteraceae bacterium]|nr:hypothetical protein [Paludibacteraceae bacterium]